MQYDVSTVKFTHKQFLPNLHFFVRILDMLLYVFSSKFPKKKAVRNYTYARLLEKDLWKPLIKIFHFIVGHGKNANAIAAEKASRNVALKKYVKCVDAKPLDFSKIDCFFHSGIPRTEFPFIQQQKVRHGFKLGVIIHDIIAIRNASVFNKRLAQEFQQYLPQVLKFADFIVTDSKFVKQDLTSYINEIGAKFPAERITPVQLATDSTPNIDTQTTVEILEKYNINAGKYAIILCTVEPRKSHRLLLDVWSKIAAENPESLIPLVVVGGKGWMTESIQEEMATLNYIIRPPFVQDEEKMVLLKNARFSLFPSIAEGWGMPITESLEVGTPVISSDNSSMPEAGQGVCEMINCADFDKWYATILKYIQNDEVIANKRTEISQTKLRTWKDFSHELCDVVASEVKA